MVILTHGTSLCEDRCVLLYATSTPVTYAMTSSPTSRPRFPAMLPLMSAIVLALALSGCGGKPGSEADESDAQTEADGSGKAADKVEAVPVEVATVARRAIAASYAGTANLEVPGDAQVVAKTNGVLLRVLVEEGDQVVAGQALAQLDPERARLEAARSEATMRRLQNNYERSKELFDRKLVSTESNDQLRFELESAKAAFELAKLELSYTTITAPISGVIAQRFAKPGNLINVNSPVYRIIDNSRLEAVLNVPERQLATMKAGLPIQMVVDALPGQQFTGVVDRISPVVDAGSGTFRVVGAFDGKSGLRPGMFGRINVVHDQRAAVLTVPRAALIEENGAYAVYVVRDKKAVRTPVKLGYINGEFAEILEGVKEGDPLVTAGKIAVRDGSAIQVVSSETEAAPAEAVAEAK